MSKYVGWKKVKGEIKKSTGLSSISAIAEASGVSIYTLDSLFNNRTKIRRNVTGDKNRSKLDRWLKKTTDGKLSIKSFVSEEQEPSPKKVFTAPKSNEDEHKKANKHYNQVLEEAQAEQFNNDTEWIENIIGGIESEPDYDTPALLRKEQKHKEETLDEFFQSLDRYKPGLSEIAKNETDRINILSLPHFNTDDKKLRYAYLTGLERGWHEARAEHIEVLRDLLKGKIDG